MSLQGSRERDGANLACSQKVLRDVFINNSYVVSKEEFNKGFVKDGKLIIRMLKLLMPQ